MFISPPTSKTKPIEFYALIILAAVTLPTQLSITTQLSMTAPTMITRIQSSIISSKLSIVLTNDTN